MTDLAAEMLDGSRRIVVIDVEATCWKKGVFSRRKETIEIGAVELVRSDREFQSFVRPLKLPRLSSFCRELTGISQDDVDAAPLFPAVIYKFLEWATPIDQVAIASWSHYDIWQLDLDLELHGFPKLSLPYLDIKKLATRIVGGKSFAETAGFLGLEFGEGRHRALSDAKKAAEILGCLMRR